MPFPAFFVLAAALGAREHIREKRAGRKMLDAEADRQDEINNIDLGIEAMGGTNQFDAQQMQAMGKQFQTAQAMLRSQDPKMQSIGANMLQDLDGAVRGNIQQNENEARADFVRQQDQEVVAAGLGQEANERRFTREMTMNTQLNNELKAFTAAQLSHAKVTNLLDNDDQLASLAGLTAFVQAIDNSVVREGELLKYQGANGMITQIVNLINKSEGKDFDPATKQSIRNAAGALVNAEKSRAIAVTNSYQDRAVSFGLNPERVLSGVDESMFTPMQIDKTAQLEAEAQADIAEQALAVQPDTFTEQTGEVAGFDIPGDMRVTINPSDNITNRFVKPFISMTASIGRTLRGAKLMQKNDGTLWIQEADGSLSRVTNQDFKNLQEQVGGSPAQLTPDLQRRQDDIDAQKRAVDREGARSPGLFQEGGFFDRP